ncbi:hypothetical protein BK120_23185 [Paenibacillus sp. FSL A5-0031]|uniref:AAA family ATPase n=1 Tax=Paenibacillus sp. FSL A5-0031 TaxID=1920420 RepID=UPI00096FD0FC|nr:hypothetical protein [Paenibacillus sp. FSL A5-0031]OME78646.1 hypothetical protein BK120_23185 [Paenibacillus sp. FSL A5-0031]
MKILIALTRPLMAEKIGEIIPKSVDAEFAFNENELSRAFSRVGQQLDYLVVHEELFEEKYPWIWLSHVKSAVSESTKVMVILSTQTDSIYREIIKRISLDFQVSLIQGALSANEIAEELNGRIFNKTRTTETIETGRLSAVMSASPKDGATTVAISTAICMAQRLPDKKVLLVDLNLKSPEIRDHLNITTDKGYPLIQADCDSGTLEQMALIKACDQIKGIENLYILTGIQRREWAEKITVGEIDHLLSVSRKTFDFTIADVHTYPDQAATLKCIKDADERIVVVQSVITSYQSSWNDWFNSVWQHYGLTEKDFNLVLNRDQNNPLDGLQIEKGIGTKIISRIRNVEKGAGLKAINFGQPLYLNESPESIEFRTNILSLAGWLANRAKVELTAVNKDNKSALRGKQNNGIRRFLRL